MSTELHKALARRLYEEVFGAGNLAAADEILAPDCVSHGPGTPPVVGSDGIKRQAGVLRGAFPDLRTVLEDQVAEGDRVASRWTGSGTHTGTFGMPGATVMPSGQPIRFSEIRIDRFADGRIVESWFIPDRFTLWQQLGLIPEPGGPSGTWRRGALPGARLSGRAGGLPAELREVPSVRGPGNRRRR